MIRVYPGSLYPSQLERYNHFKLLHPNAIILKCGYEKTGIRFGQSKKRLGKCYKIGSGGRNFGQRTKPYQLWVTWSEIDIFQWRA